uniref:Kininogen 1 n=1 Tax=Aotus nancymaae TaxID=37293 RepID=A0A2K5D410_AOTNA|nr:kininogen-1 [Aotus nancymaae]
MKLITILFLCSRLLLGLTQESQSEEIDCNDKDLFEAVDAALKKYNNQNLTTNQFVLYRITEGTKMVGSDTFYSFKYEIKEGDCPRQNGKTWQDCDYKDAAEAATGECTATVGKRGNTKFSVAIQSCQITPADSPVMTAQYYCLGCVHPVSTKSPDLEPILRHGVQYFNNNTNHSSLFMLSEVKQAQRQVVSGWNFLITYSIVQTNCSKENFLFLTPDCKSLWNGDIGECTDDAYMDTQLRITSFSQKCDIYPGEDFVQPPTKLCVGCPRDIPTNSPELEETLTHTITKLNAENNETFYFKIDNVKRARVQVVAGKKYFIDFVARETTCSKESNEELTKSCETKKLGQSLDCNAEVYVVPWEKKIYPTVKCEPLGTISLMKRPPGFSPFRTSQAGEIREETTVSPPHTSTAPVQDEEWDSGKEQGHTRRHDWGHEKQRKHGLGHGHKHERDHGLGYQRGHGLGWGHQQQHGLGVGHKFKPDDLEHQGGHGLDHGHKHKHGHGHEKHKNKGKKNGKHNGWKTEHLASSSEDSTTSSAHTREKTEGPTPIPSLTQPGVAVTPDLQDFRDSDLIATMMPNIPPAPTESDDDWIPDIQIQPNGLSFNQISDFPDTTSPKCPGRPWKSVSEINPITKMKESYDFDLADALY